MLGVIAVSGQPNGTLEHRPRARNNGSAAQALAGHAVELRAKLVLDGDELADWRDAVIASHWRQRPFSESVEQWGNDRGRRGAVIARG
jgi:hypothetical protein